jgi:hypothetical protein
LDTDWSYTLFFAFSAALAASFNMSFHLTAIPLRSIAAGEFNVHPVVFVIKMQYRQSCIVVQVAPPNITR